MAVRESVLLKTRVFQQETPTEKGNGYGELPANAVTLKRGGGHDGLGMVSQEKPGLNATSKDGARPLPSQALSKKIKFYFLNPSSLCVAFMMLTEFTCKCAPFRCFIINFL